jgi:hypothetical protein
MTQEKEQKEQKDLASNSIEAQQKAEALSKKKLKVSKRNTTEFAVVAVEKQSNTERRKYMRDFHNNEALDIVRHKTNKSKNEIVNLMTVSIYDALSNTQKVSFKTADFIDSFKTFGSSYGDIIRSAVDDLASKKYILKRKQRTNSRTRATYLYVTNINEEHFKALLATLTEKQRLDAIANYNEALKASTKF